MRKPAQDGLAGRVVAAQHLVGRHVDPITIGRLRLISHGPGAWSANPWVVALTFTVAQRNIDAMEKTA